MELGNEGSAGDGGGGVEDEDGVDGDRVCCHPYWGGDGYIGKWLTGETERTED